MEEIKPAYTTYEQAKYFKEIGFETRRNVYEFNGKDFIEISDIEQWQVVEWLRIKYGIEVVVIPDSNSQSQLLLRKYTYSIFTPVNGANLHCQIGRDKDKNIVYFRKPQEAYSAAFDYIRNNKLI